MTSEEMADLLKSDKGPVLLVNLLRFRDFARYDQDERGSTTGEAAYALYLATAYRKIAMLGGELVLDGNGFLFDAPQGSPPWQRVIIVRYPSPRSLAAMLADEDYQAALIHRSAAIDANLTFFMPPVD